MTVLCVTVGCLVPQYAYSRLAKSEAPELVLLTVARGKKTGAPKQHSDCDFISPVVILRGSQIWYKRGNE